MRVSLVIFTFGSGECGECEVVIVLRVDHQLHVVCTKYSVL
jgi:hypothetical protein